MKKIGLFVMFLFLAVTVAVAPALACDGDGCGSAGTAGYFNTSTSSSQAFGNFDGSIFAGSNHSNCAGGSCGGYFKGGLNGVAMTATNCGALAFGTAATGRGNSATVSGGYEVKSGASYSNPSTGLSMWNSSDSYGSGTSTTGGGYYH
jgi:hypothetical protein